MVVSLMISAILSSPWVRGTPDLGASPRDLTPKRANLLTHFETVKLETSSSSAFVSKPDMLVG